MSRVIKWFKELDFYDWLSLVIAISMIVITCFGEASGCECLAGITRGVAG
jgi:hypothetical protein